jgi:uncharacterized protein GlcG (DUF336 family)
MLDIVQNQHSTRQSFARRRSPLAIIAAIPYSLDPSNPRTSNSMKENDMSDITAAQARAIVDAARAKATDIKTKMNIAVVDAGGNLKAFLRMDGAWLGSIDIAQKKAKTARYFDMPTGEIGKLSQPGGSLYNIEHSNNGLITFPGGIPIRNVAGDVIGAIGVSGDAVENDHIVAQAGVDGAPS